MTNPLFPNTRSPNSWPAPSKPEEVRAVAALAFEDAERRLVLAPDELGHHIRHTAWRITREIARVRGLVVQDREALNTISITNWLETDEDHKHPRPPETDRPTDHAQRLAWSEPLAAPKTYSATWAYLAEFVAAYLAVPQTGPFRAALNLLLEDPHQHWPSPALLVDYDDQFIEAVSRRLLKQSRPQAARALQRTYGLLPHEAKNLCGIAAAQYEYLVTGNKTAQRGLLLARLDDFAHRMREAMHPREEFQALKEMGTVLGLKQPEKEAEEEDMTDVINRVCREDDENQSQSQIGVGPPE